MSPAPLSRAEKLQWLRLDRAESVGPVAFRHLIERFGSAEKALAALPRLTARAGSGAARRPPSLEEVEAELAAGEGIGARLIAACEPDYPELLAALDPPPPLIWVRGKASLMAHPTIAIVGARSASAS